MWTRISRITRQTRNKIMEDNKLHLNEILFPFDWIYPASKCFLSQKNRDFFMKQWKNIILVAGLGEIGY